jgi:hypothetical protein
MRTCAAGLGSADSMRAQSVQEGSIHSPTFSKPDDARLRRIVGIRSVPWHRPMASTVRSFHCSGVSEQHGPQRPQLQHPSGRIAPEFGFRSSRRRPKALFGTIARRLVLPPPVACDPAVQRFGRAAFSLQATHDQVRRRRRVAASVGGACARGCSFRRRGPSRRSPAGRPSRPRIGPVHARRANRYPRRIGPQGMHSRGMDRRSRGPE